MIVGVRLLPTTKSILNSTNALYCLFVLLQMLDEIPRSESLKCTKARSKVYWDDVIAPSLRAGKTLLIVGHENNLRSLIMRLEDISREDIINLDLPRAIPLAYRLDGNRYPAKMESWMKQLECSAELGWADAMPCKKYWTEIINRYMTPPSSRTWKRVLIVTSGGDGPKLQLGSQRMKVLRRIHALMSTDI